MSVRDIDRKSKSSKFWNTVLPDLGRTQVEQAESLGVFQSSLSRKLSSGSSRVYEEALIKAVELAARKLSVRPGELISTALIGNDNNIAN